VWKWLPYIVTSIAFKIASAPIHGVRGTTELTLLIHVGARGIEPRIHD
jgi:hypothetical protein